MAEEFISKRRLVMVAQVATVVARAENWMSWEALIWLAQQVESGTLAPTLYKPPDNPAEDTYQVPEDESRSIWRSLARHTKRRSVDPDPMPAAASTWYVHVESIERFARSSSLTPSAATAVRAWIADRLPRKHPVAEPSGVALPEVTAERREAARTPKGQSVTVSEIAEMKRLRAQGKTDEEVGAAFDRSRTWVAQKIGSKLANRAAEQEEKRKRNER